jgi:hypothetical protein
MKDLKYYTNFYIDNKMTFNGESGHELLIEYLIPIINLNIQAANDDNKNIFIDVGSCVGNYTTNLLKMSQDIISFLYVNNFKAYMISTLGLLPVYGEYWSDIYESNKQWSNVFAINNNNIFKHLNII